MKRYKIVRYIEFSHFFEIFFLTAILTILGIRAFLLATGWPQIAFSHFHIAHMLWGGLLMALALFGFMTFLNDDFKPFLSGLGGVGFGFFIDELGKYITKDNNYHYQPTFAIMYIIFICLYLLYKNIAKNESFTSYEYMVNAAEKLKEIIIHDLDKAEQEKALEYISKSKQQSAIAKFLKKTFTDIEEIQPTKAGLYTRIKLFADKQYKAFIRHKRYLHIVLFLFILRSLSDVLLNYNTLITIGKKVGGNTLFSLFIVTKGNTILLAQACSLIAQAVITCNGAVHIFHSRARAYRSFRNALLISVFILEVFSYYRNPFWALLSTAGDLLLWSILNYSLKEEATL